MFADFRFTRVMFINDPTRTQRVCDASFSVTPTLFLNVNTQTNHTSLLDESLNARDNTPTVCNTSAHSW